MISRVRQSRWVRFRLAWPQPAHSPRRGSATLDYALVLGAMMPIAGFCLYYSSRIIKLVYEMTCALVSWPFM